MHRHRAEDSWLPRFRGRHPAPGVLQNNSFTGAPRMRPPGPNTRPSPAIRGHHPRIASNRNVTCNNGEERVPKEELTCRVCNVQCSSAVSLKEHLSGKKHKANIADLDVSKDSKDNEKSTNSESTSVENKDALIPIDKKPPMQNQSASKKPAHVRNSGLKSNSQPAPGNKFRQMRNAPNVAEIHSYVELLSETASVVGLQYIVEYRKLGSGHQVYFCELCDYKCEMECMIKHLTSRKHRLRFTRVHFINAYIRVTGYPSFKSMMVPAEADKFLAHVCARVVKEDHARGVGLPRCHVKPYKNESEISVSFVKFERMGKMHPSLHEDVALAENIMDEAESIGRNAVMQPLNDIPVMNRNNGPGMVVNEDRRAPNVPISGIQHPGILFLKKEERGVVDMLRLNTRDIDKFGPTGMLTAEHDDLRKKLDDIRNNIQKLLRDVKPPSFGYSTASHKLRPALPPNRKRERPCNDSNAFDVRSKHSKLEGQSGSGVADDISAMRKAVEPIIAETRRQVEEKIYEAIESGDLHSVLHTFENNPHLKASLLQWEREQQLLEMAEQAGSSELNQRQQSQPGINEGRANHDSCDYGFLQQQHDINHPAAPMRPRRNFGRPTLLGSGPNRGRRPTFQ